MTKKRRRMFDINFEDGGAAPAPQAEDPRRGPMATAISETAEALDARASTEAAIRSENDALAHEHVRLKKLGLITDLIPISEISMTKLTRDRSANRDPELDELKTSIQAVGLSNPIRVEQTDTGYELIQGFRRLSAFGELATETGDPRYSKIPASMVPKGEDITSLYRKMVDENLVRRDISFAEMAALARGFAGEQGIDVDASVELLYASAGRQKRSYIRHFAELLGMIGPELRFPEELPRALGLELRKRLAASEYAEKQMLTILRQHRPATPEAEVMLLRDFLSAKPKVVAQPKAAPSQGKTTLRIARPDGAVKVLAREGRLEVQQDRDFSAVDRARLEDAVRAFFDSLSASDLDER